MDEKMRGLVFDIKGKYANFKKYYSNSSSLSYYFPPRTTLTGIMAAILGKEKESYYKDFSCENLCIGISVKNKLKKSFHKLNYLKIESYNDLNGSQEFHTQVPFEIVSAADCKDNINYRVYISQKNSKEDILDELKSRLVNREQIFPIYLGKAGFRAEIHYSGKEYVFNKEKSDQFVLFDGIIAKENIIEIDFSEDYFMLVEDYIPLDFIDNFDRELKERKLFVFSNGKKLRAKVNNTFYSCIVDEKKEYFDFME